MSLLELCKKQGYVPEGCTLDGHIVLVIVKEGESPCKGCREDRSVCGGSEDKDDT